jgi:type II secretory pathway pseudopilin PulG
MIELIFVIVIIGILAAVAIPKLAATRDDAKQVKAVQNLATCLGDIAASFTATGQEDTSTAACKAVINVDKCFTINAGSNTDGNVTVNNLGANKNVTWCKNAIAQAASQDLNGTHVYGGNQVKF